MFERRRPINIDDLNERTRPVIKHYRALEREIFNQMARTLKYGKEKETKLLEYQVQIMQDLHRIEADTIEKLAKVSGRAKKDIIEALVDNGAEVIKDTDAYLRIASIEVAPVKDVRRLVDSYINQTFLELDNYINETLITTNFGTGTLALMYRDAMSDVQIAFTTGQYSLNEAIERAVMKWVDKGAPSSFVDRGGHRWSLHRYAKTVLRSTNSRIYNDLRTNRMAEHGLTLVVMSSKLSARPACAPIQGKVIDISQDRKKPNYPNIYDYGFGTPAGTRGINCGHLWFPFREGVSENNQVQYDPEEAMEMEKLNQKRNRLIREKEKLEQKADVAKILESEKAETLRAQLRAKRKQLIDFEKEWKRKREDFYYRST